MYCDHSKYAIGLRSFMAKRGKTVPIAEWWYEAVRRKMGAMKLTELAEIADIADVSALSRCLSGEIPTIHLVEKVSDVLHVPRPIWLPQTEREALVIHGAVGLHVADEDFRAKAARAAESTGKRIRKP